jgi:hypothetical protein
MEARMNSFKEELMQVVWNPDRLIRLCKSYSIDFDDYLEKM